MTGFEPALYPRISNLASCRCLLPSATFNLFALQAHNKTYLLAGGREPV
nr:MAG TPA: hypothetical protein [Caudoviricetes sp.]